MGIIKGFRGVWIEHVRMCFVHLGKWGPFSGGICRKAVSEMMDELYVDLAEMARMYSFELTGQYSEGETEVQVLGNEEQVEKEIVKKKWQYTQFYFFEFPPTQQKIYISTWKAWKRWRLA